MDSDGDRMDSSVLPSSCCREVVWDQAHHVFSIQSVHFWDLSQGLLGLVFLSSEHFLCTSPKNQSGSRRNSSRRAWVAHGTGAKNCLLETNCVLKCSTHVCPSIVCLSAGGYMWMAGRMEQGEGVRN